MWQAPYVTGIRISQCAILLVTVVYSLLQPLAVIDLQLYSMGWCVTMVSNMEIKLNMNAILDGKLWEIHTQRVLMENGIGTNRKHIVK